MLVVQRLYFVEPHRAPSCFLQRRRCVCGSWLALEFTDTWVTLSSPHQSKARHWHHLVTPWANVSEHWLSHPCTKKRSKNPGLCAVFKPSIASAAQNRNGSDSHFTLLSWNSWLHSQSFCQEAYLARKVKNREQEVGEAFYGMAFSPLLLKGFFLQFVSVWVRSMC